MIEDRLKEMIKKYRYSTVNQFNRALDAIEHIEFNPIEMSIRIPGVYHQGLFPSEGECGEIVFQFLKELDEQQLPGYYYVATGLEPKFIPDGNHTYVLRTEAELLPEPRDLIKMSFSGDRIKHLFDEFLIIDPCFQIVTPYVGSDYSMRWIQHPDSPNVLRTPDLVLVDGELSFVLPRVRFSYSRPLGMNGSGDLCSLYVNFDGYVLGEPPDPSNIFQVSIIAKENKLKIDFPIPTEELHVVDNPEIEQLMYRLREFHMKMTEDSLFNLS